MSGFVVITEQQISVFPATMLSEFFTNLKLHDNDGDILALSRPFSSLKGKSVRSITVGDNNENIAEGENSFLFGYIGQGTYNSFYIPWVIAETTLSDETACHADS